MTLNGSEYTLLELVGKGGSSKVFKVCREIGEDILLFCWGELYFLFGENVGHVIGSENIRTETY